MAHASLWWKPGGLWECGSPERPAWQAGGHCSAGGLADLYSGGFDRERLHILEGQPRQTDAETARSGEPLRLADALPAGRPEGWAGAGNGQIARSGGADGVGHSNFQGLADVSSQGQDEGRAVGWAGTPGGLEHPGGIGWERGQAPSPGHHNGGPAPQRPQGQHGAGVASAHRLSGHSPGPVNGLWRDADWLFCRDGRWRPVEPGTFPLAHGAAARVGRLRGYGNAINAAQAEEFIRACMAELPSQPYTTRGRHDRHAG